MTVTNSAISIAIQVGVPVLAWGPPGVGKTAAITMIADALSLPLEVVLASVREPADFAGLPVIREDGVHLEAPAWAKRLAKAERGELFLDEISTAPPAVQAALLRVVVERVTGDLTLPKEICVVAAANPPEQAAGGWNLSAPLANRFCHLEWVLNVNAWIDGMTEGWPAPAIPRLPSDWKLKLPVATALVTSFIRVKPHLLLDVPKNEDAAGKAWPSPRTWEMAIKLLAATLALQTEDALTLVLISGCVGDGVALEFMAWQKALDLPDPEELLRNPQDFKVFERGDKTHTVLASVIAAAISDLTKERWQATWQILARAAEQGASDVAAVAARTLVRARKGDLEFPREEVLSLIPILQAAGIF